jgi:hypothetical protein
MEPHPLPLMASVPFINCHWKTDIFQFENWGRLSTMDRRRTVQDEVSQRLETLPDGLPQAAKEFLLRLAKNVDKLSHSLQTNVSLASDIGLGKDVPQTGYPTIRGDRTNFFYPFMSAIVLDRCLWAIGCSGRVPSYQWIHPFGVKPHHPAVNYASLQANAKNLIISYGSRGQVHLEDQNSLVALSANISAKTAGHVSNAEISHLMAALHFLASGYLALSVVSALLHGRSMHAHSVPYFTSCIQERQKEHLVQLGSTFRQVKNIFYWLSNQI